MAKPKGEPEKDGSDQVVAVFAPYEERVKSAGQVAEGDVVPGEGGQAKPSVQAEEEGGASKMKLLSMSDAIVGEVGAVQSGRVGLSDPVAGGDDAVLDGSERVLAAAALHVFVSLDRSGSEEEVTGRFVQEMVRVLRDTRFRVRAGQKLADKFLEGIPVDFRRLTGKQADEDVPTGAGEGAEEGVVEGVPVEPVQEEVVEITGGFNEWAEREIARETALLAAASGAVVGVVVGLADGVAGVLSTEEFGEKVMNGADEQGMEEPQSMVTDVVWDQSADVSEEQVSPFENLDLSGIFDFLLEKKDREVLEAFIVKETVEHQQAKKFLIELMGGKVGDDKFDVDKVLAAVAPGAPHSSNPAPGEEGDETARERDRRIGRNLVQVGSGNMRALCEHPDSPYFFSFLEAWGVSQGFSAETAGRLARQIIDLLEFGVIPGDNSEFLRYRMFFLELWHRAMKSFKTESEDVFHRQAYTMAQVTAKLSLDQFSPDGGDWVSIPPKGRKVPAPSLNFFVDKNVNVVGDVELVDNYIMANLSLILPDKKDGGGLVDENGEFKNFAQEEFAIFDLIALADKFGLYSKYEAVFNAIFAYRRAQFTVNFHFNPEATRHPEAEEISLVQVVRKFYKRNGRLPVVGDWGDGKGQIGRLMLKLGIAEKVFGIAEKVFGIDIDPEAEPDPQGEQAVTTFESGGKYERRKLMVKGLDDMEIQNRVAEDFPEVDILLACDVAHESSHPTEYLTRLAEKVREGGVLYVTDPTHCEVLDKVSRPTVHRFDSTSHPGSMISIEDWFNLVGYFSLTGWNIEGIYPVSGVTAGYNDPFWRAKHVLYKIPAHQRRTPLYTVPKPCGVENQETAFSGMDGYYEVWPLKLIPHERREELNLMVRDFIPTALQELKLDQPIYRLARKIFLKALMSHLREKLASSKDGQDDKNPFVTEKKLSSLLKNPKRNRLHYLAKVGKAFPDSAAEMLDRRKSCREAIFAVEILRDYLEIDLVEEVGKFPGWEGFSLPSKGSADKVD